MKNSTPGELDAYFPVRTECQADVPKTRFKPRVGKTLSVRRWHSSFSQDGHLDIAGVLRRIQRGGIHPSIKGVVWEFLLGCFDPKSTFDERNEIRQRRREQYATWKAECQKMVPVIGSGKFITAPIITDDGQAIQDPSTNSDSQDANGSMSINDGVLDKKVTQWKLSLHQIGLDVVRTDRALVFYENEANQAKLWDVLAVYAWVDNDIGYVQGMSDICSPMVILLENEADAFWCFEHAMRRVRENFRCSTSSIGVQSQLSTLSQIIKVVDPKLHQHLVFACAHTRGDARSHQQNIVYACVLTLVWMQPHNKIDLNGQPRSPSLSLWYRPRSHFFYLAEELDGGEYLFAIRMLMVLFRREFSFIDALYLWEVMWAMEYNPNMFASYEQSSDSCTASCKNSTSETNNKLLKQYGKFERKNVKTGWTDQKSALAVFLVASVLETKNKRLLKEAKGLDDVVKILGDLTGNLDAKKALNEALKIHKKYLRKANRS